MDQGSKADAMTPAAVWRPSTIMACCSFSVASAEGPSHYAKAGGGEAFDENEAYDPKTDTWLTLTKLPGGRQAIGAATDGAAAYVPGGTLRCGGLSLTDQMLVFRLK